MGNPRLTQFSPGRILLFSFITVIGIGTLLLSLPQARIVEMSLADIFFTATSSTCVTGLKVVPISSFSPFGKGVILTLIQIGGLGLITLSFFIASIFLNFGIATRRIAGELLEFEFWGRIKNFLVLIISITVVTELIGTVILYGQFRGIAHEHSTLFLAVFHSISSFCNAGISLFDEGLRHPGISLGTLFTLSGLMFAGSIGFIVWYDITKTTRNFLKSLRGKRTLFHVSLHTKITLISTILLTIIGGFLIWAIEQEKIFHELGKFQSLVHGTFTAISARGVGFATVATENLSLASLFLLIILMFIGASPGSTGSGIKTTTFVVFIAAVISILRSRPSVEIAGRTIATEQIYRVMAIVTLGIFWVCLGTFALLLLEDKFTFMQTIFETVSAFGNCGLSTGITKQLSTISKIVLTITMVIGRIGGLTLMLALRKKPVKHLYQYPEERVMIG